ncbi:tetratricopeptide repeat protein [Streptomyces sp. NPDC059752]|uniref:tetratricopeptide repeat protein n=1 Tax=unclassified Streptomyces TaxID=2593676 RepID=UPI0036637D04
MDIQLSRIEQLLVRKNGRYTFHDLSLVYARDRAAEEKSEDAARASRMRLYAFLLDGLTTARSAERQSPEGVEREAGAAHLWLDDHAQEASAAARAALDAGWARSAEFLRGLGEWLHFAGRCAPSEEIYRFLLSALPRTTAPYADAMRELGEVQRVQGRYDDAVSAHEEARTVHRKLGDKLGEAKTTSGLGDIHYAQSRYAEATEAYGFALTVYQDLGNSPGEANTISGLGDVHYGQKRYAEAAEAFENALTVYQDLGGRRGQANALDSLAHIDVIFDRRRMALSRLRRTRQLFIELGLANLITICDRALDEVKQVSYGLCDVVIIRLS